MCYYKYKQGEKRKNIYMSGGLTCKNDFALALILLAFKGECYGVETRKAKEKEKKKGRKGEQL